MSIEDATGNAKCPPPGSERRPGRQLSELAATESASEARRPRIGCGHPANDSLQRRNHVIAGPSGQISAGLGDLLPAPGHPLRQAEGATSCVAGCVDLRTTMLLTSANAGPSPKSPSSGTSQG